MSTQKKENEPDFGDFSADSLVGLALRGKLAPQPSNEKSDLPKLAETAVLQEDGKIAVHFVSYDHPQKSDRSWGDYVCSPGSSEFAAVIDRHGPLELGKTSHYRLFHDGRVERK